MPDGVRCCIGTAACLRALTARCILRQVGFLLLALLASVLTCGLLALALWHLTYANERIESLLAVATASVADRISSLADNRLDGESAEWANTLISAYLWPRLIVPLIERDVHRDVCAKLAAVFQHRHDPDTSAKVPDFIESLEIETFALGSVAPVFTAVRCVAPREAARAVGLPPDAAPADARVYDLDTTVSSERVDVTLRAFVGGGALQALDWVGSVAGALQPKGGVSALDAAAALLQPNAAPANTSLAVRIRRLEFSARLRIALRTDAEVFFFGLLPEPKPRCRVGLEVSFQTRAGTSVALPLSRVPGMASFLEAMLLREIAGAIRVPNSLPRDLRPLMQMALLPPGTRNPLPPPPSLEVCTSLLHATLQPAAAEACKRDPALGLPSAPLLCAIASDSGKRRELAVDLAADAHLVKRTDNFRVVCVPPPSAMGVMETVTFKLRRAPDLTRRLGAVRDVAEGTPYALVTFTSCADMHRLPQG